jgi:hypothetical protein
MIIFVISFAIAALFATTLTGSQFAGGHVGQFRENDRKVIDSLRHFQLSSPSAHNHRDLKSTTKSAGEDYLGFASLTLISARILHRRSIFRTKMERVSKALQFPVIIE